MPGSKWVIVGGESGPGARTINPEWVRDILIGNCLAGLSRTDGPGSSRQGLGPDGLEKDRWSRLALKTLHPPVRDWDRPWLFSGSDRARVPPCDTDPHSSGDDRTDATGAA